MLKADQIPDEVVEAAAITLMGRLMVSQQDALHVWSGMYEPEKDQFRREARASITAALSAWPGMALDGPVTANGRWLVPPVVVIPLPTEMSDD